MSLRPLLFYFLFLLYLPTVATAQQKITVDSLLRALDQHPQKDTTRVRILNQLCWQYRGNDFIGAIVYGRESIEIAKIYKDYPGEAEALNFLGVVYRNMGDYAEASKMFYSALSTAEKGNHLRQIAYSHNNIGDILRTQQNYKEALPHTEKALELFDKLQDQKGRGFAYVRLGEINQGLKNYQKSLEAFQEALRIREKMHDKSGLITSYTRIGVVNALNNDDKNALVYYKKALKISEEINDNRAKAGCYDFMAKAYTALKQYDEARKYAFKSLEIAYSIRARGEERNAYLTLFNIYEQSQEAGKALEYHKKFVALSDSLDNIEKSGQVAKMQVIHDTKRKDQEIQKERELNDLKTIQKDIIIGLAVLALVGTVIIVYLTYRSRQKQIRINQKSANQANTLMHLGKNNHVQTGNLDEALQAIVQATSEALHIDKVSVWQFDRIGKQLICLQGFDTKTQKYDTGRVLTFAEAPTYFSAIEKSDTIKANDCLANPYTAELAQKYYAPDNIKATIDMPIFSEVGLWGVLCGEVRHKTHKWKDFEVAFIKSVSDIISIAYKSHQRKLAEELLQQQKAELVILNTSIAEKKKKIEEHSEILLEISKNESILNGNWQVLATEVTHAILKGLKADVAQIWYYNFKEEAYYGLAGKEDTGAPITLQAEKIPIFAQILQDTLPFSVEDVQNCTKIDEVSKTYLLSQNIHAFIFYPNILSEKQKGVLVCASAVPRTWEIEDLAFMKSMEDEIVIAYQGYRRSQAQEQIKKQSEEITKKNESMRTTLRLIKQEQKRTDELLLNILPWEIAEELRESGHATPKQYELATVVFTDFKGFTKIAEKLTPQEVIEELNTCFFAFDEICEKYKLEKIKTMGDGYMCAGGLPTPNTTNPIDAVSAALEMQQWMTTWAETKRTEGKNAWEVRIGIHSGEIIAGVVGKKKFSYDIWGDTVNTASRMESSGEVGKVNISAHTYELVKHAFHCTYRGRQVAKNKGEIDMYFVDSKI